MPPRDPRTGRFVHRRTRRNPFLEDALVKPFLGAMVGHVGGRVAKAAADRAVKARKRTKKARRR